MGVAGQDWGWASTHRANDQNSVPEASTLEPRMMSRCHAEVQDAKEGYR